MRYVYLLRCADASYYTGITTDLIKRVDEHNTSPLGAKYTRGRRPVELVRSESCPDRSTATKLELQIKQLSRQQKTALINQ